MDLHQFNINDIYNKNIILLGRKLSGKTCLIRNILKNLNFDSIYLIDVECSFIVNDELNLPTYGLDNFNNIYKNIIETNGRKLLIIENFQNIYQEIFNNSNLLTNLLSNNQSFNLTTIIVTNYFKFQINQIDQLLYKYINIIFLSSVYLNMNNYIYNLFFDNISEKKCQEYIDNYLLNQKFLVSSDGEKNNFTSSHETKNSLKYYQI